ncbi:hypothetical protein Q4Q39_05715 [Flavivirga amylovorans]|uniref:Uncharacterized protein n=1 Tax=Flavivirga amylovorans TaxID=870486 RepID=A0ABT8WZ05_9FLAO|nr:hypothetical protein [Flavivirga amylovorans]MDO5986900.1 hypothetical protein [Flavivirga amylovorans]
MGKTRNLNGIPGNLALSYLSTLGYYDGGYMADWLNFIARDKNVKEIEIDILNNGIDPEETDIKPLKADLKKLRGILEKELSNNGFEMDFIKKAVMKFEIPIDNPKFKNTVYCYPFIEDENGKIYKPKKRIIETAYEVDFNPIKKLRMKTEHAKKNWIDRIKAIWN